MALSRAHSITLKSLSSGVSCFRASCALIGRLGGFNQYRDGVVFDLHVAPVDRHVKHVMTLLIGQLADPQRGARGGRG